MSCPVLGSCPCAQRYTALLDEYPTLSAAVITGGGAFAWYAMPDAIRSRAVRTLLKAGLLSVIVHHQAREVCKVSGEVTEAIEEARENGIAMGPYLAAGWALAGISVTAAVVGERLLFRRGERRRAQGYALAHTRQALPLAALALLPLAFRPLLEGGTYEYAQEGEGGCGGNCDCSCGK